VCPLPNSRHDNLDRGTGSDSSEPRCSWPCPILHPCRPHRRRRCRRYPTCPPIHPCFRPFHWCRRSRRFRRRPFRRSCSHCCPLGRRSTYRPSPSTLKHRHTRISRPVRAGLLSPFSFRASLTKGSRRRRRGVCQGKVAGPPTFARYSMGHPRAERAARRVTMRRRQPRRALRRRGVAVSRQSVNGCLLIRASPSQAMKRAPSATSACRGGPNQADTYRACRRCAHPPAHASRAKASALARKRHQAALAARSAA
jgi:hypothetical protein